MTEAQQHILFAKDDVSIGELLKETLRAKVGSRALPTFLLPLSRFRLGQVPHPALGDHQLRPQMWLRYQPSAPPGHQAL